jgi:hypothetical protein
MYKTGGLNGSNIGLPLPMLTMVLWYLVLVTNLTLVMYLFGCFCYLEYASLVFYQWSALALWPAYSDKCTGMTKGQMICSLAAFVIVIVL